MASPSSTRKGLSEVSWVQNDKNVKLITWHKNQREPMGQRIADEYSWLVANPVRAQEIAGNASQLIQTVLTPDVGPR